MVYVYVYTRSEGRCPVSEQAAGILAKRKFIFELGVGGPDQDVIDKLESADVYRELIVKAVRQYREEAAGDRGSKS